MSDTYILRNKLNWVTFFVKSKPNYLLEDQICYQADFTDCLAWPEIGCPEWIRPIIETALEMFCLSAIMSWVWWEVKAVNTEALLMQNDSCIANNTDWVGSSVCV